jgi:hypothetical protein
MRLTHGRQFFIAQIFEESMFRITMRIKTGIGPGPATNLLNAVVERFR